MSEGRGHRNGLGCVPVAECRYLADRLIEAWGGREPRGRDGVPGSWAVDAEPDSVVVDAQRQTIEQCLDPGRPFTLLDADWLRVTRYWVCTTWSDSVRSHEAGSAGRHFAEQARQLVDQLTRERLAITVISSARLPALQVKREQ